MNTKNESKVILKQWVQVFMGILVLIALIFSIFLIYKSVKRDSGPSQELYAYSYNSNMNYKVYIKQNQFFNAPYMGMNKQYIASLIDRIEVNAKYNLETTKDVEYTYKYEVIATAKGIYAEADGKANDVWSKVYQIAPVETKTGTGKAINIDKTVNLDYNTYNKILTDFRNEFGLSIDGRVDLAFKIEVTGGLPGKSTTLNESNVMGLQIPLLKSTVQLKPEYVNSGRQVVTTDASETKGINIPLLAFGVLLLLFSLVMLKAVASKLLTATKKSEYILQLNKILKEYGDIVAESENLPDLTKYDVVAIKQFNDLVDIEEELHSPIICTEIREDLESWFIIIYGHTAYRYILKYENFGKIINNGR